MKYEIQKEFKAVLVTKIYSHKDSVNNSLICLSIHSNLIKFTCNMLNMIITIIFFFSTWWIQNKIWTVGTGCSDVEWKGMVHLCLVCSLKPFNSKDLIVNSPLWLLRISLLISYENLVLNQDSNLSLISLNTLITCLLNNIWIL